MNQETKYIWGLGILLIVVIGLIGVMNLPGNLSYLEPSDLRSFESQDELEELAHAMTRSTHFIDSANQPMEIKNQELEKARLH